MAILWQKVQARTASALGALAGTDTITHESNYTATIDTTNIKGADWGPTQILDACVETVMEIASDLILAEDPEADTFTVSSSAIASGSTVPTTSSGSIPRIGKVRRVKDSTNSRTLNPASVDQLKDFLATSGTVFNGLSPYVYAIDGSTLLHTRSNVICDFGGFTRATITVNIGGTDVIPLTDRHENAIVAGAISKLATQEGQYMDLAMAASNEYAAHRAMIRNMPKES